MGEARCARHPERPVERACERCGDFVCGECLGGAAVCRVCKDRLGKPISVPWEDPERRLAARYALTVLRGLFTPRALFKDGAERSPLPSFAFGIPGGILGCLVFSLYSAETLLGGVAKATTHEGVVLEMFAGLTLSAGALLVVTAIVQHALCRILGGKGSFETSLRVAFYTAGSAAWTIAIGGPPIAFLWYHATSALALREVHGRGAYMAMLLAVVISGIAGVAIAIVAGLLV
jgi:hypothetical protein